jgi:hypothetical protein
MFPRGLAVAGVASLVEPATSSGGGGGTDPTISSSLGNVEDQTGAYAPTLTVSGGATVETVAYNNVTGAVSVTGSTTTTPSVPEPAAGSATLVTHTATASSLTKTIAFVVGKASTATPFWTLKKSLDLTAMTPTSLVAGSQTVDGETIYCDGVNNVIDASGLTVGSGGATVAYVTMGSYLTDYDRPLFVQIKSAVTWVGTGGTSTVRWRAFRDTAGTGPSIQWVADVNSTNLDIQAGFQDGGTGNPGTFGVSAGATYTGTPSAVVLNFLLVGNQAYVWMTETLSAAGDISTMMAPAAGKVRVSYCKESDWNSGIWAALIVGVYRDTNSIPIIEQIDVYEGS